MGPPAPCARASTARKRALSLRSDPFVAAPAPLPFTFVAAGHECLAWYHGPSWPWRDLAVVLCASVGHEAVTGHATQVQLARTLAQAGFPVVRFDYPGTGDASDCDEDSGQVAAWRAG